MKTQVKILLMRLLILNVISLILGMPPAIGSEKLKIHPSQVTAGTYQKIQFEFVSDSIGIAVGGGMRIELPVAYFETKPYYWDQPQKELPAGRGYVEATSSGNALVGIKIYGSYGRIIECVVQDNPLNPGESILLNYQGIVQSFTWKLNVRAQWRKSEHDPWHNIKAPPEIKILPQKAVTILVVTPSNVQRSNPFELAVVLLDKFGNRATDYRGTVIFSSTDSNSVYPKSYTFTEMDSGIHVFQNISFRGLGFQSINATDGKLKSHNNYSFVTEAAPKLKRFFGDTHFHTGTGMDNKSFALRGPGGDHRGHFTTETEAYKYARDVMRLDFASASEHDNELFTEAVWNKSQDIADSFYSPGKFTTFFAYEWTSPATSGEGHHVVLYKDRGSKVFGYADFSTKLELWNALDKQDKPALVIPHVMWTQPDHGIWDQVNNKYRVIGEIYSLWNNRFLLPPGDDSQRFELGRNDLWSYQYAWANGHKIGVIGSTDNHTGHPGANNFTTENVHSGGLAVVLAEDNNREDIWNAIQNRRTYATSGTRIYLDFTGDDHEMGSEYTTSKPPLISVKAAGTNKIEIVEVVKFDGTEYRTIYSDKPAGKISMYQFNDKDFSEDSMYYVRVRPVDEIWRSNWAYGNAEMAWSSPIWVNYAE